MAAFGDDEDDKRRRACPIQLTLMAAMLLIIGTVFLVVGIPELIKGADGGTALVTLGSLTFLPGSYACIVLFGAWQRWRGYSYDSLPAYD